MAQRQSDTPGVRYALEPVDHDPFEMTAGELAGASDPADPTGGAALTVAPMAELSEDDKTRAHLAWLKAQGSAGSTILSRLKHSLDPRVSDDAWVKEARDAQIRSGAWSGVGRPAVTPEALAGIGGRFVADQLGATKGAYDLGAQSQAEFARSGHMSNPEIAGGSAGLALGLAAGGMGAAEPGAAGIFGGRLSQTAPRLALDDARVAHAVGQDGKTIWQDHGWYKDVDGNWKYEIPDADAKLHPKLNPNIAEDQTYRLGDALHHPALFSAYPEMADYNLGFNARGNTKGWMDMGHQDGPTLHLNPADSPDEHLSVALHELQHGVQDREGFARGAAVKTLQPEQEAYINQLTAEHNNLLEQPALSPQELDRVNQIRGLLGKVQDFRSAAYSDYSRSAGETEARNVQSRFGMTPEESRALHPDDTADVEPVDRRVRFAVEGGPASQSIDAAKLDPSGPTKPFKLPSDGESYSLPQLGPKGLDYIEKQYDDLWHAGGQKFTGNEFEPMLYHLQNLLGTKKVNPLGDSSGAKTKLSMDQTDGMQGIIDHALSLDASAPSAWSPAAAKLLDEKINFHKGLGDDWYAGQLEQMKKDGPDVEPKDNVADWHEEALKLQPKAWSPKALEYLNGEKAWFGKSHTIGGQNSYKAIEDMIAGGPTHELPISDVLHSALTEAKAIHADENKPPKWNPAAESHLFAAGGEASEAGKKLWAMLLTI